MIKLVYVAEKMEFSLTWLHSQKVFSVKGVKLIYIQRLYRDLYFMVDVHKTVKPQNFKLQAFELFANSNLTSDTMGSENKAQFYELFKHF